MGTTAILGAAGAIGIHTAKELARQGTAVKVVGRTKFRLDEIFGSTPGISSQSADLSTAEGAKAACEGADTIVFSAGAPYNRFELHPIMIRNTVQGAVEAGARRLLLVSNVYSYGVPQSERVTEEHPREPHTRKGRFRKEQEEIAMDAHRSGKLEVIVLHLPDFLGPEASIAFSTTLFQSALANSTANWLGSPKLPHEFIYVPDVAPVIATLLQRDDVWGEHYNLAGSGTITGEEFIQQIYYAACRRPRYRTAGKGFLRVAGVFSPVMRELVEMMYLLETPLVLDDQKLQAKIGPLAKTPYANAITATIAWLRGIPSLA
jgi:nucleoside-diphosphate-sugar epimerase